MVKFLKLWVPVVVWTGVIFYCSSLPDLGTKLKYDFILRKIAHVVEYLILNFFLYRAFTGSFKMNAPRLFIYPAFFVFLYAVSDEIHQSFVPGRSCAIRDVLIDSVGVISFYIFIKLWNKKGAMVVEPQGAK